MWCLSPSTPSRCASGYKCLTFAWNGWSAGSVGQLVSLPTTPPCTQSTHLQSELATVERAPTSKSYARLDLTQHPLAPPLPLYSLSWRRWSVHPPARATPAWTSTQSARPPSTSRSTSSEWASSVAWCRQLAPLCTSMHCLTPTGLCLVLTVSCACAAPLPGWLQVQRVIRGERSCRQAAASAANAAFAVQAPLPRLLARLPAWFRCAEFGH